MSSSAAPLAKRMFGDIFDSGGGSVILLVSQRGLHRSVAFALWGADWTSRRVSRSTRTRAQ